MRMRALFPAAVSVLLAASALPPCAACRWAAYLGAEPLNASDLLILPPHALAMQSHRDPFVPHLNESTLYDPRKAKLRDSKVKHFPPSHSFPHTKLISRCGGAGQPRWLWRRMVRLCRENGDAFATSRKERAFRRRGHRRRHRTANGVGRAAGGGSGIPRRVHPHPCRYLLRRLTISFLNRLADSQNHWL